jgi:sterol 3beta-glucosyltransferase
MLTYGTRGDVEPFVSLGLGLERHGYRVLLAAPKPFAGFVESRGIPFAGLEGDPASVSDRLADKAGLNPLAMMRFLSAYIYPLAERVLLQAADACQDCDAILHTFLMTDGGHHLAVERGIPDISAQFFPVFSPTGAFPAPVFPDWPLGPAYRRFSHRLVTSAFRFGGQVLYRRLRRARPHLPRLNRWGLDSRGRIEIPLMLAYSRLIMPVPPELGPRAAVTGYWSAEMDEGWLPDPDLAAFIEGQPPPVYMGFGSMASARQSQVQRACVEAARSLGLRVVLSAGPGSQSDQPESDCVHTIAGVPHGWLFPRMGAVVHHGGSGTTGAASRAGVPQVVIPFSADQAFWGRRVERLGVAPPPIPLKRLSVERVRRALAFAVGDGNARTRAAWLGEEIRKETGVENAVGFVREIVGPP